MLYVERYVVADWLPVARLRTDSQSLHLGQRDIHLERPAAPGVTVIQQPTRENSRHVAPMRHMPEAVASLFRERTLPCLDVSAGLRARAGLNVPGQDRLPARDRNKHHRAPLCYR